MDSSTESVLWGAGIYSTDPIEVETIDTIDEIDVDTFVLMTYRIINYVFRRYLPTKIGGSNLHKHGSWWCGPYQVT